jgi:hypothetical protein
MERSATAEWNGALQGGKGKMSTASGVLADSQYSFATRFEDGKGTNPEELIAAAHAGCFSMALSAVLGEAKLTPDYVKTQLRMARKPAARSQNCLQTMPRSRSMRSWFRKTDPAIESAATKAVAALSIESYPRSRLGLQLLQCYLPAACSTI